MRDVIFRILAAAILVGMVYALFQVPWNDAGWLARSGFVTALAGLVLLGPVFATYVFLRTDRATRLLHRLYRFLNPPPFLEKLLCRVLRLPNQASVD